jgi:putative glutathione S-transferase
MGPFPDVEEGFEDDWAKLKSGGVLHPAVVKSRI